MRLVRLMVVAGWVGLSVLLSACGGSGQGAVPGPASTTAESSSPVSPSGSPLACSAEAVKDAPKLTFGRARTLIGTRPWYCDIDTVTGRFEVFQPPDTSTSTEEWMRAISTDVALPKGFDEETSVKAYVAIDGHWYRVRYAGGEAHDAPAQVSPGASST